MDSIEEKRVYGDRGGAITVYIASGIGVVRVRVAGDAVGEFGLCERCDARDVAATRGGVAVATDEDVRLLDLPDGAGVDEPADETFVGTDFGPAVAVGNDDGELIAAGPDGRVAARPAGTDEWTTLEDEVGRAVRAIDGDLVGTDGGVYRVHDGGLDHAGLTDVRDVSAAGVPLAATADGLYKLGNGWMEIREGAFDVVAADPRTEPGRLERAHAVADRILYEYDATDDEWQKGSRSSDRIVGVDYGETVYAVTAGGVFRTATDGTWRKRALGVTDVTGIAVPRYAADS
ncbi:HVO_0234 family beta-propeller protein [Natrinema salsiterrestre]|uniref:HVO-0234-like beta-propeller domain-containing protein n=1 Tax=Natrinema salsiterrestre TaxID=2950540 RepID=A0A9Q4Q1J1_9EURY|nr:hypothetical protein [Natrinema salsiterrestre]MDF9747314.1 hypothetical protein [Natrinema salsiterrestre]